MHTDIFLFYSVELRIFIDHSVKTVLKRIDSAQLALAEFLNSSVFGNVGPITPLRKPLGAAEDTNTSILARTRRRAGCTHTTHGKVGGPLVGSPAAFGTTRF